MRHKLFTILLAVFFIAVFYCGVKADSWTGADTWHSPGYSITFSAGNSPDRGAIVEFPAGMMFLGVARHTHGFVFAFEGNVGIDLNVGGVGVRVERFLCSPEYEGRVTASFAARASLYEGEHVSLSQFTGLAKLYVRLSNSFSQKVLLDFGVGATYAEQRMGYANSSGPVGFVGLSYFLRN